MTIIVEDYWSPADEAVIAAVLADSILTGHERVELRMDLPGILHRFRRAHEFFSEALGEQLLPVLQRVAGGLTGVATAFREIGDPS